MRAVCRVSVYACVRLYSGVIPRRVIEVQVLFRIDGVSPIVPRHGLGKVFGQCGADNFRIRAARVCVRLIFP